VSVIFGMEGGWQWDSEGILQVGTFNGGRYHGLVGGDHPAVHVRGGRAYAVRRGTPRVSQWGPGPTRPAPGDLQRDKTQPAATSARTA
jgi:hypothetical protein